VKLKKKITAEIKINFFIELQFTYPQASIKDVLATEPSALKSELPALQNMKILNFFYFCGSFLLSWIRPDTDPLT